MSWISYLMIALPFVLVLGLWVLTFVSLGLIVALWLLSNLHIQ